ncbi:MAG: efflux RND transporter periplasmic adaptor subunit [Alphaproteobacteria bacterium]
MMRRLALLLAGAVLALALLVFVPGLHGWLRQQAGLAPATSATGEKGHGDEHAPGESEHENPLKLTEEQIAAAGIKIAPAQGGSIGRLVTAPATIAADIDRLNQVTAKIAGTIAELKVKLGDQVTAGQVLATIESREIAEAKSEFLAAARGEELARITLQRESTLWQKRVTAEQDVIKARADADEARIKLELARQKLSALGLGDQEIAALSKGRTELASLRLREVRAPMAGRIIEQQAVLGAPVGPDTKLFTVADLATVWVEMAVPTGDLPSVKEGQTIAVTGAGGERAEAKIIFVSPVIDPETRSARAVARLANPQQSWRPGSFVTASIASDAQTVDLLVPREALQTIDNEQVVFVRTPDGFEKREVVLGRGNEQAVEIVFGLDPGEQIAVANSFTLKAQLAKAEAEHSHSH